MVVAEEDRQLALFQRCGELSQAVVGQLDGNVLMFCLNTMQKGTHYKNKTYVYQKAWKAMLQGS